VGFVPSPAGPAAARLAVTSGAVHAFSVLSETESDLRRPPAAASETFGARHSLALLLVGLAAGLLAVEWGLFHKRLTE